MSIRIKALVFDRGHKLIRVQRRHIKLIEMGFSTLMNIVRLSNIDFRYGITTNSFKHRSDFGCVFIDHKPRWLAINRRPDARGRRNDVACRAWNRCVSGRVLGVAIGEIITRRVAGVLAERTPLDADATIGRRNQ